MLTLKSRLVLAQRALLLIALTTAFAGFQPLTAPRVLAQAAGAAKYEELPIPEALDVRGRSRQEAGPISARLRELHGEVAKILSGELPLAGSEAKFDGFFNRYFFPRWTFVQRIENTELNKDGELVNNFNFLANERKTLFVQYMQRAKVAEVHTHLVKLTLAKMVEIAKGNFHPVARYNAMVVIGELNEKEHVVIGAAAPAEPYAPAVPVMIEALGDKKQLDVVKIASLMGLVRYVEWDSRREQARRMPPAITSQIDSLCLAIVEAQQPPPGRSMDGHVWMQRRSLEILGYLGTLSTNVNTVATIDGIVGDVNAPISLRCSAAEALGQLNLPPATKINAAATTKKLAELAVYACLREVNRLDDETKFFDQKAEWQRSSLGGVNFGGEGPPRPGPGMMQPNNAMKKKAQERVVPYEPYNLSVTQRRIKSQMYSLAVGLEGAKGKGNGILGLASSHPATEEFAKQIAKEIGGIRDATDDASDLEALLKELRQRAARLDELAKAGPAGGAAKPAAAAAPADDIGGAAPASQIPAAPEAADAKQPAAAPAKAVVPE